LLSNECIETLRGHEDKVNDLCLNKDKANIISGSSDKTIKIWCFNSYQCLVTLDGHKHGVNCVKLNSKSKLISASNDKTIRVWNLDDYKKHFNANPVKQGFQYNSGENTEWVGVEDLRKLIKEHVDPNFSV
jgi:WD40 repeat protein